MCVRCLPFKVRATKLGKIFDKIDRRCDTEERSGDHVWDYPCNRFVHELTTLEGPLLTDTRVLEIRWYEADRSAIMLPRHLDPDLPAISTPLSSLGDTDEADETENHFWASSHSPQSHQTP